VTDECQLPARQGEHNTCVLAELGLTPAEIAALKDSGALVQHEQWTEAAAAG
jgi:crotonobetainyl-CoA:carnitine CoA-transferase CaiB-like acyl-CoA transferase